MDYNRACKVLNLDIKHTEKMLKKAYHIAALKNHPDKNPDKKMLILNFKKYQKHMIFY